MGDKVTLVNEADEILGVADKIQAHENGALHRAFSIFVFNSAGELLIQKRASMKYHSANLWSNTCCGHPGPDESAENGAHRRLKEELGFDCYLRLAFSFTYRAYLGANLFEHEYDHVFVGVSDQQPSPNPNEVNDWMWVNPKMLMTDIEKHTERYTCWLKLSLERTLDVYRASTGSERET
jgi:isopentenyl-diphosphate Delta-isomerase